MYDLYSGREVIESVYWEVELVSGALAKDGFPEMHGLAKELVRRFESQYGLDSSMPWLDSEPWSAWDKNVVDVVIGELRSPLRRPARPLGTP